MAVTYSKLRQLKIDLGFQWQDITNNANISAGVTVNINKDKYVKLESLEEIVNYLNDTYNLNLDIGDIVSIKKEKSI